MFEDKRNHEQNCDFHRLYQPKIVLDHQKVSQRNKYLGKTGLPLGKLIFTAQVNKRMCIHRAIS